MVAAVEHGSGLVLGQTQIPEKTNENPAVRNLAKEIGLQGRAVTLEVMHAQEESARSLVEDCRADYLVTAIKGNQETILEDLVLILIIKCGYLIIGTHFRYCAFFLSK